MLQETPQNPPRCIICAAPSGKYFIKIGPYRIYKCGDCGLEYTWPIPSEEAIRDFYKEYSDVRADRDIVTLNAERNFAKIKKYFDEDDFSILDFGCGNGEFVEVAGEKCLGLEIHNKTGGNRIITDINEICTRDFSAITLWGVLEHLTDPVESIRRISEMIKSDGIIAITTVDAEGNIPFYYKPPEHLTYWTNKSIEILMHESNFDIIEYEKYGMMQKTDIYIDRLLSRTPEMHKDSIMKCRKFLPDIIEVPTNEVFIIARRRGRVSLHPFASNAPLDR